MESTLERTGTAAEPAPAVARADAVDLAGAGEPDAAEPSGTAEPDAVEPDATEPDTAELAARLRVVVIRTSRGMRRGGDTGLSPSLTAALIAVARRGPLTPSQLADGEQVKRPTATRLIACLEQGGLVSRDPDPDDGRSYRVGVTPRGARLLASSACRRDAYLARGIGTLTPAERATLERAAVLLERLLDEESS